MDRQMKGSVDAVIMINGVRLRSNYRNKRLYTRWRNMRKRCFTPSSKDYYWYGAKGITVCEEWSSFRRFREWFLCELLNYSYRFKRNAMYKDLVIDRIDPSKGYSPCNCRLITASENSARVKHSKNNGKFTRRKNENY